MWRWAAPSPSNRRCITPFAPWTNSPTTFISRRWDWNIRTVSKDCHEEYRARDRKSFKINYKCRDDNTQSPLIKKEPAILAFTDPIPSYATHYWGKISADPKNSPPPQNLKVSFAVDTQWPRLTIHLGSDPGKIKTKSIDCLIFGNAIEGGSDLVHGGLRGFCIAGRPDIPQTHWETKYVQRVLEDEATGLADVVKNGEVWVTTVNLDPRREHISPPSPKSSNVKFTNLTRGELDSIILDFADLEKRNKKKPLRAERKQQTTNDSHIMGF